MLIDMAKSLGLTASSGDFQTLSPSEKFDMLTTNFTWDTLESAYNTAVDFFFKDAFKNDPIEALGYVLAKRGLYELSAGQIRDITQGKITGKYTTADSHFDNMTVALPDAPLFQLTGVSSNVGAASPPATASPAATSNPKRSAAHRTSASGGGGKGAGGGSGGGGSRGSSSSPSSSASKPKFYFYHGGKLVM